MSAGGAFGGARGYQPRPPEKGVFPLDHFGECKALKDQYLDCLKASGGKAQACTDASKKYLECRMERNLMAPQDLKDLCIKDSVQAGSSESLKQKEDLSSNERKQKGFVAGIKR